MDYQFTKANLADFKRFWEGETGDKYKKKMEETRKQLLQMAMGSTDHDQVFRCTAIANGIDSIIQDIEATIKAATEEVKKTDNKESKGEKLNK